jgi:Ca-activated chloride channel family protein
MAAKTGGRYFRARDTTELAQSSRDIDGLEPGADKAQRFRPVDELFFWPLAAGLLLALAGVFAPRIAALRIARGAGRVSEVVR